MPSTTFRPPVFVRKDDTTEIEASVVEWGGNIGGISIRIENGDQSVLINAEDWPAIISCIARELNRVQ